MNNLDEVGIGVFEDVLLRVEVGEFLEVGVVVPVEIDLLEGFAKSLDRIGSSQQTVTVGVSQTRDVEGDCGSALAVGFGDD